MQKDELRTRILDLFYSDKDMPICNSYTFDQIAVEVLNNHQSDKSDVKIVLQTVLQELVLENEIRFQGNIYRPSFSRIGLRVCSVNSTYRLTG
jgi:hypothetical protein